MCGALVAAAAALTTHIARGEEVAVGAAALRELVESTDFRVRANAAVFLGRTRPLGAREALERALGDAHPAVRAAAAAALGSLGDPAALGTLERRLAGESSASVRAQIQSTVEVLRRAAAAPAALVDARRQIAPGARFVVRLGNMRNGSGVRGDELRRVLHAATRSRARALHGAAVVDGDGAGVLQLATGQHLPVVTLDGLLSRLTESTAEGSVQVNARVEFAMRREQELRGVLSGAATTFGSGQGISDQGRRQLQDDAVDGAVQSALRGAEQGLFVAAR
jgi:hypothetical protein